MGVLLLALHLLQAGLSARAAHSSYHAIANLQPYESSAKKAAKWIGTAEKRLHKTRTTQASGAIALLASAITALVLAYYSFSPSWFQVALNLVNAIITYAARGHIQDFWQSRWRVPFVSGYNKGIKNSNALWDGLGPITVSWVVSSVLTVIG